MDARNGTNKQTGFTPIHRKKVIEIGPGDVKQGPQWYTPTDEQTGESTLKASTVASR